MVERIRIKVLITIALATVIATGAGSIVTSKDSLWIFNNSRSGRWTDTITIKNNGLQGVRLDSVRLRITEWNTPSLKSSITEAEARMEELHQGVRKSRYCTIDSVDPAEYRLNFSAGMPSGDSLFAIGSSGDSVLIYNVQIGYCFSCSLEKYPRYIVGTLRFYFSNGEAVGIRIYSDDLRPTSTKQPPRVRWHAATEGRGAKYLLNGQLIPGKVVSNIRWRNCHRLIVGK